MTGAILAAALLAAGCAREARRTAHDIASGYGIIEGEQEDCRFQGFRNPEIFGVLRAAAPKAGLWLDDKDGIPKPFRKA